MRDVIRRCWISGTLALVIAALSMATFPAWAQSDADSLARRMQALQIELTNRLTAIEQSIRFVTDLIERLQRDQRAASTEVQGLVNDLRTQFAEIKAQLPASGAGGFADGPGLASAEGTLGVIRRPVEGSDGQQAGSEAGDAEDPQAEQINALLDAIGDIGTEGEVADLPTADEQFANARDLLRDGFLSDASDAFKAFIQSYPEDSRVPDAHYWMGEAQFGMNRFRAAAEAHYKVVQEYGGSQRAPDSLLRMGMIFQRQGNSDAACKALQSLAEVYPNASDRLKARANSEALKAGCPE